MDFQENTTELTIVPHFCGSCGKIMIVKNYGNDLYYVCRGKECSEKIRIEENKEKLIYLKNYGEVKKSTQQADVRQDPTYPRMRKLCDRCNELGKICQKSYLDSLKDSK